jgi:hypothetical protein
VWTVRIEILPRIKVDVLVRIEILPRKRNIPHTKYLPSPPRTGKFINATHSLTPYIATALCAG